MYRRLLALASASLLALACNSTNPVEPGPPPGSGGGSGAVVVAVQSDRTQVEANSTQPANLKATVTQNGAPMADGTEVAFSTNIGNFGLDGAGQPMKLVKKTLAGGSASTSFFAGADMGTANILAQVGTSVGKVNLALVTPSAPPVAAFSFEVSALSVLFQDTSTGTPTSWTWDFGDGAMTSKQNPLHTYAVAGTYTVSLTVANASAQTSMKRQFVTVEAGEPLIANFSYAVSGLSVLFSDISSGTPTSWSWTFGDGKTSTVRSPSHVYARTGTYAVTLVISNAFGVTDSASQFVTLGDAPKADFTFEVAGLATAFSDTSTGGPTGWSWDFGDGTGSSTAQNPKYTYSKAGTYSVTLTATNSVGSTTKTKLVTVSQGTAPTADFTFQANVLMVAFADQSTGSPTSWSWDFGDGMSSTRQNPTHTYAKGGTYAVVLTATNSAGSNSKTQVVTVSDTKPPFAAFCYQRNGLQVFFTDQSLQGPTQWQWDFGDCTSPASCQVFNQNPSHTYTLAGSYQVKLTVSNSAGQSSITKTVAVSASTMDTSPVCF